MDEVSRMKKFIKIEFIKLKRYSVVKAGVIMSALSALLSFYYSTADDGRIWTFEYFMRQVLISNCTLFFPLIITLIAGYIITREYTNDTLKNIVTIPVSFRYLLYGKLITLLLLTIGFSLVSCITGLTISIAAGFPGISFVSICMMFFRTAMANIFIYAAVLPVILLFSCSANNFLAGVAVAFIYGYFGTFEGTLLNYFPIKAGIILSDPGYSAEYGISYRIFPAIFSISACLVLSFFLLARKGRKPQTVSATKKKKAKTARKKGW